MRTGPVGQNVDSLTHLRALLLNVCQIPKDFLADSELRAALKSQHRLAKYASSDSGITPTSLNTQKRLSARLFEDGFKGLDNLRFKAAERLIAAVFAEQNVEKNKRSVTGLNERVAELKLQLSVARQDCWHLSAAFARAVSDAANLAADSHDAALQARWVKNRRELLAMVTLSSRCSYFTDPIVVTEEAVE